MCAKTKEKSSLANIGDDVMERDRTNIRLEFESCPYRSLV